MAAWVDYPDEEIPELDEKTLKNTLSFAKNELKELLDNYESGMIMTQGVNTVIAGRPNRIFNNISRRTLNVSNDAFLFARKHIHKR